MMPEDRAKLLHVELSVNKIENSVDEIKQALLGNRLSGDKGFKGQIEMLNKNLCKTEADLQKVKEELQTLRDERIENRLYKQIIGGLVCAVVLAAIGYFFTLLKN